MFPNKGEKILFVCHGNVGRSQMCQALYNQRVGSAIACSAGLSVFEHEGQRLDENRFAEPVIRFMMREGIDLSKHTRKQVTPEMIANTDRVIVLTEPEAVPDFFQRCNTIEFIPINDPAGADDDTYQRIIKELKALVEKLLGIAHQ